MLFSYDADQRPVQILINRSSVVQPKEHLKESLLDKLQAYHTMAAVPSVLPMWLGPYVAPPTSMRLAYDGSDSRLVSSATFSGGFPIRRVEWRWLKNGGPAGHVAAIQALYYNSSQLIQCFETAYSYDNWNRIVYATSVMGCGVAVELNSWTFNYDGWSAKLNNFVDRVSNSTLISFDYMSNEEMMFYAHPPYGNGTLPDSTYDMWSLTCASGTPNGCGSDSITAKAEMPKQGAIHV